MFARAKRFNYPQREGLSSICERCSVRCSKKHDQSCDQSVLQKSFRTPKTPKSGHSNKHPEEKLKNPQKHPTEIIPRRNSGKYCEEFDRKTFNNLKVQSEKLKESKYLGVETDSQSSTSESGRSSETDFHLQISNKTPKFNYTEPIITTPQLEKLRDNTPSVLSSNNQSRRSSATVFEEFNETPESLKRIVEKIQEERSKWEQLSRQLEFRSSRVSSSESSSGDEGFHQNSSLFSRRSIRGHSREEEVLSVGRVEVAVEAENFAVNTEDKATQTDAKITRGSIWKRAKIFYFLKH